MTVLLRPYGIRAVIAGAYRALKSKWFEAGTIALTIAKAQQPIPMSELPKA
jgi:hypothetical protein